jgi:hypothetical protein
MWGFWFWFLGLRLKICGLGFRSWSSGLMVRGLGLGLGKIIQDIWHIGYGCWIMGTWVNSVGVNA